MQIFLDTANIEEIRQAAELGVIDGVTTNPSLIAKEKRDFIATIREICEIVDGPISAEVISLNADEMVAEGRKLAEIHENVVVKVPFTRDGLKATYALSQDDIDVNMTLIFSPNQALLAAKAGARYISPFAGRLDDIGQDGIAIASQCQDIISSYDYDTEIIAASIRHTQHVFLCAQEGIDIATIPFKVLLQMMKHPLTDIGIEQFLNDWKNANK
ncbi:MAG: fructose-6-phosphate aldolase [Deferribacteraceae bacterium]|jgi:transaldolase|nr:fructose-6-phosphate aldolase [Deferribacteraceae bacterium]